MKKLILLVILAATAWWYFIGGRSLSEESVRTFYQQQEIATLKRAPEELCSLLDDRFQATGTTALGDQSRTDIADKEQTCDGYRAMYQGFEALGDKMGGILQLDYNYTVHSIELAPDKKSATVDVSYSLDVAGSIMNIRARSSETLIRKNGKTLMARSEGKAELGSGK
jgi:hypothetical protein